MLVTDRTRVPIEAFRFLAQVGTVNVSGGHFVDEGGRQVGSSFTGSIPIGDGNQNPVSFLDIAGLTAYPDGAVRVRMIFDNPVWWAAVSGVGAPAVTDFKANYARYPIEINDPSYNVFGRGSDR